jgi:biopolymer transport protein ExbD
MPLKTQSDELPNLNLTSLIDVVFLLIVFFMAASKFADSTRDVELRLPEVADGKSLAAPSKNREVAVFADGRVTLDNTTVTLPELTARLAESQQAAPGQSVVILGDAGCAFQHVARALAACKEAGVSDLAVSVRIAQTVDGRAAAPRR